MPVYYVGHIACIPSDELCHHGIKGMKWGVRRWQNKDGTFNAAGKERYFGSKGNEKKHAAAEYGNSAGEKKSFAERHKEKNNESWKNTEESTTKALKEKLNIDREKSKSDSASGTVGYAARVALAAVSGNIPAAIMLGAEGIQAAGSAAKENAYLKKREKTGVIDSATGLYKKTKQMSDVEDMKIVNPGLKNFDSNTKNNCVLCTTAYDLRKRGYDVTAGKDSSGYNFFDINKWYSGAKLGTVTNLGPDGNRSRKNLIDNTISDLSKQPNGARGNILLRWSSGGGHSIVYQVNEGKVTFLDTQIGKVYSNPQQLLKAVNSVNYVRLDNLKPNVKQMKKDGAIR